MLTSSNYTYFNEHCGLSDLRVLPLKGAACPVQGGPCGNYVCDLHSLRGNQLSLPPITFLLMGNSQQNDTLGLKHCRKSKVYGIVGTFVYYATTLNSRSPFPLSCLRCLVPLGGCALIHFSYKKFRADSILRCVPIEQTTKKLLSRLTTNTDTVP